jgi:hypothetical protein
MKYFFLSDGWQVGRIWEFGGLWNESAWRRTPEIQRLPLGIIEAQEKLWLYQVEEAVLMVEVKPPRVTDSKNKPIGQVVLKRLITPEQVIERLASAETILNDHQDR